MREGFRTSPVDKDAMVQLLVDGSTTTDEVAQMCVVGKATVKAWLNQREAGLATRIARAERERFLRAEMLPVIEWMEENEVHNKTKACIELKVSYQKFVQWLGENPEQKARWEAIRERFWAKRRVGDGVPVPRPRTREELDLMRLNVKELEAKRDEHAAELDRLLDELREHTDKRTGS